MHFWELIFFASFFFTLGGGGEVKCKKWGKIHSLPPRLPNGTTPRSNKQSTLLIAPTPLVYAYSSYLR